MMAPASSGHCGLGVLLSPPGPWLSRVGVDGSPLKELLLPFLLSKLRNQVMVMGLPQSEALGAALSAASLPGAGSWSKLGAGA